MIALVTVIVAGRYASRQVRQAKRQVEEARNTRLSQEKTAQDAITKQAQLAQETLATEAREAELNRRKVSQPNVVVFIDHNPKNFQYLDLVVKNFGQTPAYHIELTMDNPLDVSPYHLNATGQDIGVTHLDMPQRIAVLAPGQEWRTLWDSAVHRKQHAGQLSDDERTGRIRFWDKANNDADARTYENPILLDPKMFHGILRLADKP
nr:hypothetical protein [Mycobacterium europaeum]MEA1159286.1 hypothetical protein [Mycobacterium europaeum]